MPYEYNTLGSLLSDSRIKEVAKDAIRNRDLEAESLWDKALVDLKSEQFFSGEIGSGIKRLYAAAETGDWYYPLYSEDECAEDETKKESAWSGFHQILLRQINVHLFFWFPAADL